MKNRKIIGLFMVISLFTFSIASCGSGPSEKEEEMKEKIQTIEEEIEHIDSAKVDIEETSEELDNLLNDLD